MYRFVFGIVRNQSHQSIMDVVMNERTAELYSQCVENFLSEYFFILMNLHLHDLFQAKCIHCGIKTDNPGTRIITNGRKMRLLSQ